MCYIREKDGMIAVYRNLDFMIDTFGNKHRFVMNADFLIEMDRHRPQFGLVKKDRHGLFSDYLIPIKKVLEIINFLYESEKNSKKE